jgi:diguanylate cyclase (GGDEF)-like protein
VYKPVLESSASSSRSSLEVETQGLGIAHPEIGAQLLLEWGLPKRVCQAIAVHHGALALPDDDPELRTLAQVVQLATLCGEILSGGDLAVCVPQLQTLGSQYFNLDGTACGAILTELQEKLPVAAQMLDLEMDEKPLEELRKTATELLLRESLALQQQISVVAADAQLLKLQSDLEERVQTDALTGLKNRGFFDGHLSAAVARARSEGSTLGLLIVDVDHFKRVNDEYGHPTGDELLRRASAAIRATAGPDDACCRYGGEEFAVVCPRVTEETLLARAEQIREAIGAVSVDVPNGTLRRTASVGGCVLRGDGTAQQLLERADRLLYKAKSEGRDRCFVATLG